MTGDTDKRNQTEAVQRQTEQVRQPLKSMFEIVKGIKQGVVNSRWNH